MDDPKDDAGKTLPETGIAFDTLRKIRQQSEKAGGITAEAPFCSFCGKGKNQVSLMIEGPKAHICNECVTLYKSSIS